MTECSYHSTTCVLVYSDTNKTRRSLTSLETQESPCDKNVREDGPKVRPIGRFRVPLLRRPGPSFFFTGGRRDHFEPGREER